MMHRRSLLGLFGFGAAAAAVLPMVTATAAPRIVTPPFKLAFPHIAEPPDTWFADAYTAGPLGQRYKHTMPATLAYRGHAGRPYRDDLVASFIATFTGTVREVRLRRDGEVMCRFSSTDFDSPNVVCGSVMQIRIGSA